MPPLHVLIQVLVLCCAVLCYAVLCCVVLCFAVLHCIVLCCAVLCCVVLCCVVLCCVVLCCAEGAVTRRQWPGCLPTGTGKRKGCVCSTRAVCQCVVFGGKWGSRGNLDVTLLVTVVIPEVPDVLPLSPRAGAGVAPATPPPSCCLPGPRQAFNNVARALVWAYQTPMDSSMT